MPEEPSITMTEFKTVIEDFKSEQRRMSEYMLHLNQKMDSGFQKVGEDILSLKEQVAILHVGQTELRAGQAELQGGQIELRAGLAELQVGQTELRTGLAELRTGQAELRTGLKKVGSDVAGIKQQLQDREEYVSLERRVAKLESKVA